MSTGEGEDPFEHRFIGPEGHTDQIAIWIEKYLDPGDGHDGDLHHFRALPHTMLIKVAVQLTKTPNPLMNIDDYFSEFGVGEALALGAKFPIRKVSYEGTLVTRGRNDERFAVRALNVIIPNETMPIEEYRTLAQSEGPTCAICLAVRHYKRGFRLVRRVGSDRRCHCGV
jgi:hypothetical protein